jgi:CRP-like cAMP-binding protein/Fe-S-cluster-containing hydrogenase component 2
MKAMPIFAGIAEGTLKKLQPNVLVQEFKAGETILREGDYSDAAYYIASGVVQISLLKLESLPSLPAMPALPAKGKSKAPAPAASADDGTSSRTIILTDIPAEIVRGERVILETGELFGEMSALSRYPVSATVKAETDTECVLLRTPALRMMQRTSKTFKEYVDKRYRERSLTSHLLSVPLFKGCDPELLERLKTRVDLVSYEPGQVIVEQGAKADSFLLVRGGYVKVGVRVGSKDVAVTYLRKGDYAGETPLLLDEPWPFTLSALEHVEVVKITDDDFRKLVRWQPGVTDELWRQSLDRLKARGRASREPQSAEYLDMAMDTGLIHGESVLLIDLETCTRCDDCVRACANTHGGTPRFVREGLKYRNWLVPTSCYECTDPVCMIGCPTGAITRNVGTTEVVIDPMTCIGCGNCARRCPWDNIVEVPYSHPVLKKDIKLATKCDQCIGRKEGPACVQMCPHGSAVRISFKDFATVAETLG